MTSTTNPLQIATLEHLWNLQGYDGLSPTKGGAVEAYDAFPSVPGQMLFFGLRGFDVRGKKAGGIWTDNKHNEWNDTLGVIFVTDDGERRLLYTVGTTDPGRFRKRYNKKGDLWLMPSRASAAQNGVGGGKIYWLTNKTRKGEPAKHRGRLAFHLTGQILISRDRDKNGIPGEVGEVAYQWVDARSVAVNMHGGGGKDVGRSSAGCQVSKGWAYIDSCLTLAGDSERLCKQTVFGYWLLDEKDFDG